jgi:hypothetical protein
MLPVRAQIELVPGRFQRTPVVAHTLNVEGIVELPFDEPYVSHPCRVEALEG